MSKLWRKTAKHVSRIYHICIIWKWFRYEIILKFLKEHNIVFSLRTLKSRLREYELRRTRNDNDLKSLLCYKQSVAGPRVTTGLCFMGVFVPRNSVMSLLRELDPQGVSIRRWKKLKRRCYHSLGPNDCWHIDGYEKIKRFGLPIIGCIDGFSRKILWLEIVNSNNDPFVTASAYLNFISELEAIPRRIRTDCST